MTVTLSPAGPPRLPERQATQSQIPAIPQDRRARSSAGRRRGPARRAMVGGGGTTMPLMALTRSELARMVDHTLLKPEATPDDVAALCAEANDLGVFSVCISPSFLPLAQGLLSPEIATCTVVGFPSGKHHADIKAAEAAGRWPTAPTRSTWSSTWARSRRASGGSPRRRSAPCGRPPRGSCSRSSSRRRRSPTTRSCAPASSARRPGADFVKTSTGFHPAGGASAHAISLMANTVGGTLGVKASGGVRTAAAALEMIAAGATRLGLSGTRAVLDGLDGAERGPGGCGGRWLLTPQATTDASSCWPVPADRGSPRSCAPSGCPWSTSTTSTRPAPTPRSPGTRSWTSSTGTTPTAGTARPPSTPSNGSAARVARRSRCTTSPPTDRSARTSSTWARRPSSPRGSSPRSSLRSCRERGLLLDAIVVQRDRWKNLVRRAARDLKDRRKPPGTIMRRGMHLYRVEQVVVDRATAAGCRPLGARETREALTRCRASAPAG